MSARTRLVYAILDCVTRIAVIVLIGFLLYRNGYNQAVKDAHLIRVDDTSYMIAYNGESHQCDYE